MEEEDERSAEQAPISLSAADASLQSSGLARRLANLGSVSPDFIGLCVV